MPSHRRILVYGVTGAGKSTLARKIAKKLGLPYVDVDHLSCLPNWTPVPDEEQRERMSLIAQEEEWVMDTAYGKWLDVVIQQADLVVCLDYPRLTSLARLLRRSLWRLFTQEECCNGNRESLRKLLAQDSIIRWHFLSFDRKAKRIASWCAGPESGRYLRLKHPREAEKWIESIQSQ
jgi:adenylate kinase family enzyme